MARTFLLRAADSGFSKVELALTRPLRRFFHTRIGFAASPAHSPARQNQPLFPPFFPFFPFPASTAKYCAFKLRIASPARLRVSDFR